MKKIKKILIANRGEIAVRILRTARELGIETVAIFSDPDRTSSHVILCDEAYSLNGITSAETYLNVQKILAIAKNAGVDAIHPGYGFLSEKEHFAQAVIDAGIKYIGPNPKTIATLGDKTTARELLHSHSIPIVPGTTKPIKDLKEAVTIAASIGYPVLIKASGGGGGKGMRKVNNESELSHAIDRAENEALKAFGDSRIYIEKFIENPKHIEIQILADMHGNMIHFGERECSIQRRHQKVIEEAPSPALSPELRDRMGKTALSICAISGYVNAGTVEFLLDQHHNYYFLEVNTRIQVEHPVTEMVYGVDIVKEQIRIAEGEPLSYTQKDVRITGHAIEARIYAEETDNNFLPSTGTITHFLPSEGPGIRHDSGTRVGSVITPHYDPMIAKLIVHAPTRKEAIAKMARALGEYLINGVKTTIPFCQLVIHHSDFVKGTYDINFVEKNFHSGTYDIKPMTAAAITAVQTTHMAKNIVHNDPATNQVQSRWKRASREE